MSTTPQAPPQPPAAPAQQQPAAAQAAAPTAPAAPSGAAAPSGSGSDVLGRIELPLEVRLGELVLPLSKVLELREGDAFPIGPDEDQAVTLFVHGEPYAKGELVVVEERFAFRVGSLLSGEDT